MRTNLYKDLYNTEEYHWWHQAKRAIIREALETFLPKQSTIADVGCGTGKNIESLQDYFRMCGVDPSPEALHFCASRKLTHIYKGTAEHLPLKKTTMDGILFLDVLEHVDDHKALKSASAVLTNTGYIFITVPAYQWLWSGWDTALFHKRRYTATTLRNLLTSEGYAIKKLTYFHSFLVVPVFIIRSIKSLFPQKEYDSDFQLGNPIITAILSTLSALEQKLLRRYDVPFGTSILCVAQKNPHKHS